VYRLIVRRAQPDFRLVAVPSGQVSGQTWPLSPRRGDHVSIDVLAIRREGFTGSIDVRPVELPPGLTTLGTHIGEQQNAATLVLAASELAPAETGQIRLVGSATVATQPQPVHVEHAVRSGSVVWSRNGNTPAISQLDGSLLASVTPEFAPYQLTFESAHTTVHQGRQVLLPMTLHRRRFDEKLTLKFDGVAKKAKIDVSDLVFEKGQSQSTCRLFVRPDAPPGTYVVGGTCEAQVPYTRNPILVEAAAARKAIAERNAEVAQTAAVGAAKAVEVQTNVVNQATEAAKQAKAAGTSARQAFEQSQAAETSARQKLDEVTKQVAKLTKVCEQLAAELKTAKNDPEVSSDSQPSASRVAELQKSIEDNQTALDNANQAHVKAQEMLTSAENGRQEAQETLVAAEASAEQARSAEQAARALLEQLKSRSEAAQAATKSAADSLAAAVKAATEATNAAKPKNIAVNQPIPPLILTIRPAPLALQATPANGEIKAGETVDVAVTLNRKNEFEGPVKLAIALPEGVAGLVAPEVDVPADAKAGVLKVTASEDAAEGSFANLVVRARMNAGGDAIVDAPLSLKFVK
jgi:hypothetical protein